MNHSTFLHTAIIAVEQGYDFHNDQLGKSATSDDVIESLTRKIKNIPAQKKAIFLLDDCDQIIGLTQALLNFIKKHLLGEQVYILTTSRFAMCMNNYHVEPLDVPPSLYVSPENLLTYRAVELFLESANFGKPDNEPVLEPTEDTAKYIAAICRGLGGLPLAICMASSWLDTLQGMTIDRLYKLLSTREILTLDYDFNESEHQKSLDSLIRFSYDLLEPQDGMVFLKLSVFQAACRQEIAEQVCDSDALPTASHNFTNIIFTLVKHHLIIYENKRVRLAPGIIYDFAFYELYYKHEEEFYKTMKKLIAVYFSFGQRELELIGDEDRLEVTDYFNWRGARRAAELIRHFYILENSDSKLNETMGDENYHEFLRLHKKLLNNLDDGTNELNRFTDEELARLDQFVEVWLKVVAEDENMPYLDIFGKPRFLPSQYALSYYINPQYISPYVEAVVFDPGGIRRLRYDVP